MSEEIKYEVYSPASVIGIFNNALKLPVTVNLIYLKGRYSYGMGKAYSNYYYDHLYSESDNTSIGVKISGLLRSKIVNNDIYTLKGFIEKRIKNSSIELIFVVDDIISQEEKTISEEDLKRYDLIQKKLEKGSQDLETFVRDKILKGEKIKIANIYGHNAIVQKDFSEGLDVSSQEFEITEFTCNITSSTSIASKLEELTLSNFDIIALVRGGGDKQSFEAFNDLLLAEKFLSLHPITITALGHTVDETLLDKLADKRYHLPHDYGASLNAIINKLKEEKSNSRALLIEEVKKDISKQFVEQVTTLTNQLKKKNDEFVEAQKTFKENIENQTKTFNDQLKVRNEEVEKLKKDLSQKHGEQVKTLTDQLTKKNDEFIEAQKTFKENIEQQTKTFNEQLKVRNNEVEKLKKDLSEKHGEQVKTLSEQLSKKNEEFQKFQESSAKQLEDLQKNFEAQQKQRLEEMEVYKKEIASLHEKNLTSAVNEKTAQISASLENLKLENAKLNSELSSKKNNYFLIIIVVIIALIFGFIIAKNL